MFSRKQHPPNPAAGSSNVPRFSIKDIHDQIDRILGSGMSGTVYSLKDYLNLAVKEIKIDNIDEKTAKNIKFEIHALAKLSHPGILKCYQVIEDKDLIYLVIDRYPKTLDNFITEHMRVYGKIPDDLLFPILEQIIDAIAYLHTSHGIDDNGNAFYGIIHRDLKPANILITEDGNHIVLADFGLCKNALQSNTSVAGTPAYMAPETILNKLTSLASDIWSLGVIIYELTAIKKA